jgi:hypothetical protein
MRYVCFHVSFNLVCSKMFVDKNAQFFKIIVFDTEYRCIDFEGEFWKTSISEVENNIRCSNN